jgi:hypothetical protein
MGRNKFGAGWALARTLQRSSARRVEIHDRQCRAQPICICIPPAARVAVPENTASGGDGALDEFTRRCRPFGDGIRRPRSFTVLEAGDSPIAAIRGGYGEVVRTIHEVTFGRLSANCEATKCGKPSTKHGDGKVRPPHLGERRAERIVRDPNRPDDGTARSAFDAVQCEFYARDGRVQMPAMC